jgi:hypothetical protein
MGISAKTQIMSRIQHSGVPAFVALAAFFCFLPGAFGAGVVSSATESALAAAMAGGGTVTFAANGTIYLTNTIVVSNNTVLDATGRSVAISGSNSVQIFIVNSNTTLVMTNLTLMNGFVQGAPGVSVYGGAISNAGTLQVTDCAFNNDSADGGTNGGNGGAGYGGAIYNAGTMQATSSTGPEMLIPLISPGVKQPNEFFAPDEPTRCRFLSHDCGAHRKEPGSIILWRHRAFG